MRLVSRLSAVTLLMAVIVSGQAPNVPRYAAIKETTLTAAAEKVTVQQPATGGIQVSFETATVYCSVACTVTLYQNGAAATATTLAPVGLNLSPPGSAVAFSASNVGTGTTLYTYYLAAQNTILLDLSKIFLPRGGVSNFSIGTNSITGVARIQIQWVEQ